MPSTNAIKILYICSDADKDQKFRDGIEKHLSSLINQGVITTWHKGMISPGNEIENEIHMQLMRADIILPLISSDFMASCSNLRHVKDAMQRHNDRETRVVPILLCRCDDWKAIFGNNIQVLPEGEKAITDWRNYDNAFENIAKGIREIVEELSDFLLPFQNSLQEIGISVKTVIKRLINLSVVLGLLLLGFRIPNLLGIFSLEPKHNSTVISTQNISSIGWIWIGQVNNTSESLPIGKPLVGDISIDSPFVPSSGTIVSINKPVNLRKNRRQSYSSALPKQLGILKTGENFVILKVEGLNKPNSNSSNMQIWAEVGRCNQTCEQ